MTNPDYIKALQGEEVSPPPIWFMRQAGRYLPEYRALRSEAGSFLNLCFDAERAAEVTIQPIDRYDLSAAILFADILLIPMYMGQKLTFEAGEGPRLRPALQDEQIELSIDHVTAELSSIMETIKKCRARLSPETALIGFAGAPWTVATYMIAGQGVKDPAALRSFAYQNPDYFAELMAKLEEATISYLSAQIEAGAQAVQLFESWASGLPVDFMREFCIGPAVRIAKALKAKYPDVPFISFPKGAGALLVEFAETGAFDGLSIDSSTDPDWAATNLSPHVTVQGGLDPLLVVQGGEEMMSAADKLLKAFAGKPYIFNLGHGFVPQTPPEHVGALVDFIRRS